ncbi:MAG: CHAD domain-containing protein [Actinobacteria bacterium]|nr:CHAD domain-containing protein [Actinomycetota bacterium]
MDSRFAVQGVHSVTPLADAAPALLLAKAEPLFELEEAAKSGTDADAVHDMRVASRRLREAMRLLGPLYPAREFRKWYRTVRRITRALGPVRDSDVFIGHFAKLGRQVGADGARAVALLVGYRTGLREHELAVLNAELARLDLERRRRSFETFAWRLAGSAPAAEPLADFAYSAIAQRAAVVFGGQPAALVVENVAQQHELRIGYKRLRYAVEVFAPCYGDAFDDVHDTLTAFQDTLGDMHDMHVFLEVLRAPRTVAAAERAGVTGEGLAEVAARLETRAREGFARFCALAEKHSPEDLLPELLLPLTRKPEAPAPDPEPAADEDAPVGAPVIVGAEPWAEGWDAGEVTVEAAVVDVAAVVNPEDMPR